jgi:hypothetical protein
MNLSTREEKQRELASLRAQAAAIDRRIDALEAELGSPRESSDWRDRNEYWTYYATTGFFLGMIGALVSLLFNVVGSIAIAQNPLKLIQIYLTFGLGEQARASDFNDGLAMLLGCCLYIATGMIYGVPFQMLMNRLGDRASGPARFVWATLLGLALWVVNYYAILSWLQPLLFGGSWIVEEIPWYVGAATHLVFAWTMALLYPYGRFLPYRVSMETT